jgi:hypothetical protein
MSTAAIHRHRSAGGLFEEGHAAQQGRLPDPDGPITQTTSFAATATLTRRNTSVGPKLGHIVSGYQRHAHAQTPTSKTPPPSKAPLQHHHKKR